MKRTFLSVALFLVCTLFLGSLFWVRADELDQINAKLAELQKTLSSSQQKTAQSEQQIAVLNQQLNAIKNQVAQIETAIVVKEKEIEVGEEKLSKQKELLDQRVASFYKQKGRSKEALLEIIVSDSFSQFLKQFTYQQNLLDGDRQAIIRIVLLVKDIEDKKIALQSEKDRLGPIKQSIDKQSTILEGEVLSAKREQETIKNEIATLSAKQQEIVNARSGGFTVNIGDSELADDYNASIKGFRESAPGGYFAVFSFGAHTHRKGMSQYGARGRAGSGQDYRTILREYYGKEPEGRDTGGTIKVAGYGEIDFETTYLYGIAEMPSSWHGEALKAQAVAARTYAYRYKTQGTEICTTEACQVFRKSKSENPPEEWRRAVDDTKGQILDGVVTFYSSTSGGYLSTKGWDTTDGGGGSSFIDKAYEKLGGSPWLYKAWYTQSYSTNSDKCGRSNPWLSPEEMADIVNAAIALRSDGLDTSRITPVTTSCWGGNPYSMEELRNLVSGKGGVSSANSVTVSQGDGVTHSITVNGVTVSGADFKKAFNLRAPGRLSIPQSSFSFFNIERK